MSEEAAMLTSLLDMGGQIALIAILAWLLIAERKEHAATRAAWHAEVASMRASWTHDVARANDQLIELLRELAGLKASLSAVASYQAQWQAQQPQQPQPGGTRPIPFVSDPEHPAAQQPPPGGASGD